MNLSLLYLVLILNLTGSKTPNFYPNYIAAKEASKNYQKDMLIFFSKKACMECDAAWEAYEKDQLATKIFISTIVDAQDFDGAVILDKYGLSSAPSWAILDYEGNLKQKWSGEWKNPHVRPTTPPQETAKAEVPPVKVFKATTVNQNTAAATKPDATISEVPVESTKATPVEKEVISSTQPITTPTANIPVSGFVLQAGYFGSEANAMKLVNELETKGFKNYSVKPTSQNGSLFYRVLSAVYTSEAEANKIIQSLSAEGVKATVKKTSEI